MMCGRRSFQFPFFGKTSGAKANGATSEVVEDVTFGTVDTTARKIYERKMKIIERTSYYPVAAHHTRDIVGNDDMVDKTGPTFDAEKLKLKIHEFCEDWEKNTNFFPYVHVHQGEDIAPFVKAYYVKRADIDFRTTHLGWLHNDTEESFKHSCEMIANKHGAKPELVEVAMWLKNVYFMDGRNGMDIYSFDKAQELYGIRDRQTFAFMNQTYGQWFHCDVARLAQLLDAYIDIGQVSLG